MDAYFPGSALLLPLSCGKYLAASFRGSSNRRLLSSCGF